MHKDATLKYLMIDVDRHGNRRVYVRRPGAAKIRLRAASGTPEFLDEYRAALVGVKPTVEPQGPPPRRIKEGTLGWLIAEYLRSATFRSLVVHQQRARRGILLGCCEELVNPDYPNRMGDCPLEKFGPQFVRLLRDRKTGHGAANNRKKSLSAVFGWAIEQNIAGIKSNPCREVKKAQPKIKSLGYHTWTVDEVRAFEVRHPVGSMARLALALLLYTGARRQDAVEFGRQHIGQDGWLHYRPRKTAHSSGKNVDVPVLPALRAIIDATRCGDLTFLVTGEARGRKPFTANGFGNWFRKRCDEAGLPHCTAHGLRKAGATIAANNGATPHQLMAIFGWTTIKQANEYTEEVNRKKLAGAGMEFLVPAN